MCECSIHGENILHDIGRIQKINNEQIQLSNKSCRYRYIYIIHRTFVLWSLFSQSANSIDMPKMAKLQHFIMAQK